ncbi:hypothetical protein HYC85_028920 [Camellia sinensis]|uniref:40S ribosomal protein SA n=1 Tax=Camellia sinensis TaxID=4442 RepID=A0A7J7FWS1_CAMSI|nr:hypothetical protein HYC85_028920 [Camellia sinensis]
MLKYYIINIGKTWEKLQLAARYTGAHAIAGHLTLGTFTNQLQTSFNEPRLLILTDTRTDHQVNTAFNSALGNIPTIAFIDSPMRYVDIGIPTNNKGKHNIGCLFWLLVRMVLQIRTSIPQGHKWEVMIMELLHLVPVTGVPKLLILSELVMQFRLPFLWFLLLVGLCQFQVTVRMLQLHHHWSPQQLIEQLVAGNEVRKLPITFA